MNSLGDLGNFFANYGTDLGNLFFTAVVAWAALVGVKLNRRLADAELDPAITIFIEPDRLHWSFFHLVIRNAGRGSAWNIKFRVEPDIPIEPDDPESRLSRLAIFRHGINFMAPQQELRTFYGSFVQVSKQPIVIQVSYDKESTTSKRRTVQASFAIDITQFEGLSQVGEPPELIVSRALDHMAKDLHAIKTGGSFSNVTVTVKRRYFFSAAANRTMRRLFGDRYLRRRQNVWQRVLCRLRRKRAI